MDINVGMRQEITVGDYEWWPMATYTQYYGTYLKNQLNHTRMKHKNADGVAIFVRPPGVLLITPKEQEA